MKLEQKKFWKLFALTLVFITLSGIGFASDYYDEPSELLLRARVIDVEQGENIISSFGEIQTQLVTVKLTEDPYKNEIIKIENVLTGQSYYDLEVVTGDRVLVSVFTLDGVNEFSIHDYNRAPALVWLTIIFALVLVLVGKFKGVKATISLIVMGLMVLYALLPLILQGYNPIILTVGISSLLTFMFLLFISGINYKSAAALGGTIGGLMIAGLIAFIFGEITYLTGLSSSEAQLLQLIDYSIDLRGILFSGIVIGALGATLDVGISIASSMEQIFEENPKIEFKALVKRGMNVGRDMLGTMSNTLILAYLGSSLPLLLLFSATETSWEKIINLDLIATEIVRAMAGSIGLACAIPLTAIFSGLLQSRLNKGKNSNSSSRQ